MPIDTVNDSSNGCGRRKALVVGCNYPSHPNPKVHLKGCCNSAHIMAYLLSNKFGYKDIKTLRDDGKTRDTSSRLNILKYIQWLVGDARAGDSLFFHFCGHGGQEEEKVKGDERDGFNEVIFPSDYQSAGTINDDKLHEVLVRPIPTGCTLHCVIDACHSGTALDLPFICRLDRDTGVIGWTDDRRGTTKGSSKGLVVQFGACLDSQCAFDTPSLSPNRANTGAATYLFAEAIEDLSTKREALTYGNLLREMQLGCVRMRSGKGKMLSRTDISEEDKTLAPVKALKEEGQTPQLSASHCIPFSKAIIF